MTPKCPENGFHGGKRDKNPRSRVGEPPIIGLSDSGNSRRLKKPPGHNLQETLVKKMVFGVKGAAFGHNGPCGTARAFRISVSEGN